MTKTTAIGTIALYLRSVTSSVMAQTAPSESEIARYGGLNKAAHSGSVDAVARLIKNGAQLEGRDSSGRKPLHVAAFASHDEVVRVLAKAGVNLDALEDRAYDVITIAAVENDLDLLDLDLALDLGASAANVTSPYDGTALIAAVHLGHHKIVASLIEGGAPLDHINNLNWTALIEAVILGDGGPDHLETVRLLLEADADRSLGDSQGITALQHARDRGFNETVSLLERSD